MARPTKYKADAPQKVREYLTNLGNKMPLIEDLCELFDVTDDTLRNWRKKHKDFDTEVEKVSDAQCKWLKIAGITKQASATMAIFLLKANHGLSDKGVEETEEPVKVNIIFNKMPV